MHRWCDPRPWMLEIAKARCFSSPYQERLPCTVTQCARSPSAPPNRLHRQHKNEAVEPRTIAIITRIFGRVFYRPMRQYLPIQSVQGELMFCRGGWLLLEPPRAGYRGLDDYAQQHYYASLLFLTTINLRPCACLD